MKELIESDKSSGEIIDEMMENFAKVSKYSGDYPEGAMQATVSEDDAREIIDKYNMNSILGDNTYGNQDYGGKGMIELTNHGDEWELVIGPAHDPSEFKQYVK